MAPRHGRRLGHQPPRQGLAPLFRPLLPRCPRCPSTRTPTSCSARPKPRACSATAASFSSALHQGQIPNYRSQRPSRGKRAAAAEPQERDAGPPSPPASAVCWPAADQDRNEDLAGATEGAQILGYSNTDSLINAFGHGLLPDLEQPNGFGYRSSAGRPGAARWPERRGQSPLPHKAARLHHTPSPLPQRSRGPQPEPVRAPEYRRMAGLAATPVRQQAVLRAGVRCRPPWSG